MAKKVVISYNSNPQVTDAFGFAFFLDGLAIPINGFLGVNVNYWQVGRPNSNPYGIGILPTLSETIDNTVAFLRGQYSQSNLTYKRVGNTIEILMNIENVTVTTSVDSDGRFTVVSEDVEPNEDVNLKYFFEYDNIDGDRFICKINKKGYKGEATEIHGKANITKGKAKDHLDTFRGTGLDIQLEANIGLTLEDLYTDDEQTFTVRFYKNNKLVFRGFLKPDDVFESFVQDAWYINLTAIDGLGILENLSFVKENGLFFVGKMKAFDIVYYCLKRIGIPMKINTFINTYYEGLTPSDSLDPLQKIYLIADRYVKIDDNTIMSCEEVLKSVLDIFQAVITQIDGEWYIYKPNELYNNQYPKFRRYNELGTYIGLNTKFTGGVLGSQIDNFYPHHCGGNQRKKIKGAISAFRLGYKYGFLKGLLNFPTLEHDGNLNYTGWTPSLSGNPFVINDPLTKQGLKLIPLLDGAPISSLLTAQTVSIDAGTTVKLKVSCDKIGNPIETYFVVKAGSNYLNQDGDWVNSIFFINFSLTPFTVTTFFYDLELDSKPLLTTAPIEVFIYTPKIPPAVTEYPSEVRIRSVDVINTFQADSKVGEFHTVQRKNKPSSIVKANNTVYNGDNDKIVYLGAIFKEDLISNTSKWFRRGTFESKPLLQIAAEEELRIQQKPMIDFYGDIKGEMPYMSVITINNIQGKFMPIEWDYDTMMNICKVRYLELYAEELDDIDYVPTFDYGNGTVKPTIRG